MKLSVKRLLLFSYFFHVPVLIGMIHEVEPVDAMGHVDNSRYEPVDGREAYNPEIIDVASSMHEGGDSKSLVDQSEFLQPRNRDESIVRVDDSLPGQAMSSSEISVVDQRSSIFDQFQDVPLGDGSTAQADQMVPKTKVQKFVDAVKQLWNDFWNKLTGRKPEAANLDVEANLPVVQDTESLPVDHKSQLRDLALQDPSSFAAATAQTIAEKVGQAAQNLRTIDNPNDLQIAKEYVVDTYGPLQLASKTLGDLKAYVASSKKFDFEKQQNVVREQLSEQTFFPKDSAEQRDLYAQLGKQVLQPRDGIYGANLQVSELAVAYRRNRAQQMLTDNPAWQATLKLTEGSSLGVDAQGAIIVHDGSVEQQLTDDQYASLGQAYAQELPDASLDQEQLLHLARAKMTAPGTPADVKASLQEFVSCISNDFYYGDFAQFQSTGQQPGTNRSLRAPDPRDLQKVVVARQSLESDYRNAVEA